MTVVTFVAGTLEIQAVPEGIVLPPSCVWDTRVSCYRAPAVAYAAIVRILTRAKVPYEDRARAYTELIDGARFHKEPRPYQTEAFEAWRRSQSRGVVVLPTGAGKTHLAMMAIEFRRRSTLVVAPTLDLVRQWFEGLKTTFARPVGIVGGGEYSVQPLTVTTYDSAYMHMERLGARFGLIVFDECHHLPGASYALAAQLCLAPFRLGLTATPERIDGRDAAFAELIGPIVFRKDIVDLAGEYLAEYETERIVVDLSPEERADYEQERTLYRDFVSSRGINMRLPSGWSEFILRSSQSEEGRRAMLAYRRQRELAFAAPAKLDYVEHLLHVHRGERTLLFTQDNATAYEVSKRFLIPVITHQTKVRERSEILTGLSTGQYNAIVTSKVLNEGVDIPEANVAIVISGSGSVREHVQRLGRILRKKNDKRAILYELVSAGTSETFTSERRREHSAYR